MTMTSDPHWLALLRAECARTSIAAMAKRLGYSRTSISLVLAGRYPGQTGRIEASVIKVLERLACPHLGKDIPDSECRSMAFGPAPTHHPVKLGHWRACQRCPNRPKGD